MGTGGYGRIGGLGDGEKEWNKERRGRRRGGREAEAASSEE